MYGASVKGRPTPQTEEPPPARTEPQESSQQRQARSLDLHNERSRFYKGPLGGPRPVALSTGGPCKEHTRAPAQVASHPDPEEGTQQANTAPDGGRGGPRGLALTPTA